MQRSSLVVGFVVIVLAVALPAAAQQLSIAVIDVQRVVTESDPGKEALQKLKLLQDAKIDEGRALQQQLTTMQEQMSKQRFTLSEERLAELEGAVRTLEAGEEPLDRSLEIYEQAVGHLKACHEILSRAEERVRILTDSGEEDFEPGGGK